MRRDAPRLPTGFWRGSACTIAARVVELKANPMLIACVVGKRCYEHMRAGAVRLREATSMDDLQAAVGAVIRQERRARGLTLKELATRAIIPVVYLGEIERGKKYPS